MRRYDLEDGEMVEHPQGNWVLAEEALSQAPKGVYVMSPKETEALISKIIKEALCRCADGVPCPVHP